MADFEAIIRKHVNDEGNIPTTAINTIVTAIKTAVGNEFVDKERYKAKLSEIDTLKEQMQTAEDNATTAEKWKGKYDSLKADFEKFKGEVSDKEAKAAKESAYKAILKAVDLPDKWMERAMRGVDLDGIELDENGEVKNADKIKADIKAEWGDVIGVRVTQGAQIMNPPGSNGPVLKSRSEIYAKDEHGRFKMDATERQRALSEIIAAERQKG